MSGLKLLQIVCVCTNIICIQCMYIYFSLKSSIYFYTNYFYTKIVVGAFRMNFLNLCTMAYSVCILFIFKKKIKYVDMLKILHFL